MPDAHLSIGKAAEYLRVSIDTLRRWEKAGKLQAYRLDGINRFFLQSDLDKIKYGDALTVAQASEFLGVSATGLRQLADTGVIPSQRAANGFRMFRLPDLEAYKNGTAPASAPVTAPVQLPVTVAPAPSQEQRPPASVSPSGVPVALPPRYPRNLWSLPFLPQRRRGDGFPGNAP